MTNESFSHSAAATQRRNFLKIAAGVCAAATLPQARPAAAAERFGSWPIGIQSYTLRNFPVDQAIRHIQGLGLNYVEMFSAHLPLDASQDHIDKMLATLKAANIQLRAHGVNSFTKDHDKNRAVFEFAKKAGFRNISANPELDSFDSLDELAAEYDIRVCIHNHGPGALYDKLDDVVKAVK
ncbi:MAG: hypothetical protein KDA92_12780, partial [Planctomycetales bacterium]|nr:hypothetical protein [Planctomycetales bacterium]